MAGLGINIITGMLFFLAAPEQYTQNSAFAWKMGLVVLGGLSLLYPAMFDQEHASTSRRAGRGAHTESGGGLLPGHLDWRHLLRPIPSVSWDGVVVEVLAGLHSVSTPEIALTTRD